MTTRTRAEVVNALRSVIRTNRYHTCVNVPSFAVAFYVVTAQSLARTLHYANASYSARRLASLYTAKGLEVGVLVSANALTFSLDTLATLEAEAKQYHTYTTTGL